MNNFWTLVALEYKKLLYKKSIIITFIVSLLVASMIAGIGIVINEYVTENGEYINALDNYNTEKNIISELNGRVIDTELIIEASRGYDENPIMYGEIYKVLKNVYPLLTIEQFKNISEEEASKFYEDRTIAIEKAYLSSKNWNIEQVEYVMTANDDVEIPFEFQYASGYIRFISFSSLAIVTFGFLILGFIIAPVFSYEYNKNMDSLILTTKNGKNSLIYAKIFVTFTIGAGIMLVLLCFGLLVSLCVYGFDGATGPIQLVAYYSVYNFTLGQMVVFLLVASTLGGIFQATLVMLVSSYTEKSIFPMTASIIAIMLSGSVQGIPAVEKVLMFVPQSVCRFDFLIQPIVFNWFGIDLFFYQTIFIVVIPIIILFTVMSFKNFNNYQG